jgi:hypothetical protein
VTVGPLPLNDVAGRPISGLLGRDFLSPFDLDLDLPGRRMTLYDVRGCDAWFLPWTTPYAAIPAATPMGAALVVQVLVDGRPLRALIDSGASASLVTSPGIYRLGMTEELLARDPGGNGSGVGPAPVPMRRHRLPSCASVPVRRAIRRYGWRRCTWCRSSTCCWAPTGWVRGTCGCRSRPSRCSWRRDDAAAAPGPAVPLHLSADRGRMCGALVSVGYHSLLALSATVCTVGHFINSANVPRASCRPASLSDG